jgi:NAD+ synthase (glutamine-hydrolysing)
MIFLLDFLCIVYIWYLIGNNLTRILKLKKAFDLNNIEAKNACDNFFRRFFQQQFKRQALPDGPKVLDISLAPRSDYRMPSDISRK